jgi:TetR/AcrR family transcriptional repressor of mexJK operon
MKTLEETRSVRKHKAIMEAATTVFLTNGYLGATVDEIAAVAQVSKQTIYKHFEDKERLFAAIVLATTDEVDELVRLVGNTLSESSDVEKDLGRLAQELMGAMTQPHLLQLRRLIIANADRLPHISRAWYERGFNRVLTTISNSFKALAARKLLRLDDPQLAAHHFVGLLLWIPINKAMFTGDAKANTKAELDAYAVAAVRTFLAAYGRSKK